MPENSLRELYVEQLRDLYSAENQLVKALPKMAKAATSADHRAGQLVKKGQPLFTIYSPDLVSTQEEYLIAKRGEKTLGTSPFAEVTQGSEVPASLRS